MNSSAKKPFNVLDKAKSESMSDKDFEVFNRVEKRMAAASKAKMNAFMGQFRIDGRHMTYEGFFKKNIALLRLENFSVQMDIRDQVLDGRRTTSYLESTLKRC